ncbi:MULTISPECIES: TonB-dependent receptor domain-containing protein [unclassified Polynucleobacter]|jgi:Fe(3+) dicitrate transport protein|uniref:TonB-dependent receptor family protein n=1 Tax=unclassified Polynucleobacter TaxID=2640945 RepID=UPI001C0D4C6F|nr:MULTISPECIES: TonB-dependent receptor [unclassified Polynucleobacter]MBU3604942.1 TonB-dependent receptor [Polynucleobacter sp. AP-Kaivos-20-H2]MBU3618038.1 TonB-dependent receptor [Polynucleobacter sp. JS-Fieb-80-E5]
MKHQEVFRPRNQLVWLSSFVLLYGGSFSVWANAQDIELPRIDIVGREENALYKIPGTVDVINQQRMEELQPQSLQDVLKTVPGVNVRGDEGGLGSIPNIGIRGLNPSRSSKVLLLEDGAPIQPSLFISNASYYSPPVEQIGGIEVLKGASGLKYGPSNIGGVVNYLSKTPAPGLKLTGKVGNYGYRLAELEAGGKSSSNGAIGGINLIQSESNGYQDNGFKMYDILVKGGMEIAQNQWLSLKYTHYDNNINTSYVGLRPNQYSTHSRNNPAPNDRFITQRNAVDLNHAIEISPETKINTLMYWSRLSRDYWRQSIVKRTQESTVLRACNIGTDCLIGRNREFQMLGIDSRVSHAYKALGISNEAEFGLRMHTESQINQLVSSKTLAYSGRLTSQEDNKANSVAVYAQNRFLLSKDFALIPGVRVESYNQTRSNAASGKAGSAKNVETIPQIGATWQLVPQVQAYGSVYKGFAPAQLATAIDDKGVDQQLAPERSTNAELGLRGRSGAFTYDSAIFSMNFSNQIVNQSLAAGISKANGGKSLHQGAEMSLAYALGGGWGINGNATYIPVAKFVGTSSLGRDGNRIPYTPKLTSNLGVSYEKNGFNTLVNLNYVSTQYADSANTVAQNAIGTLGEVPAFTTVNWSANYAINKDWKVFGVINNVFNKRYISSRSPDGIFAGAPLNFQAGMSYQFN